jgi:hypothetical protein
MKGSICYNNLYFIFNTPSKIFTYCDSVMYQNIQCNPKKSFISMRLVSILHTLNSILQSKFKKTLCLAIHQNQF